MSFAAPVFLAVGAVALVALLAAGLLWRRRRKPAVWHPDGDLLAAAAGPPSRLRFAAPILLALAVAGAAVAAARPQITETVPRRDSTVVLVLDTSGSMAATDVEPDRMTAAVQAADRFLDAVPPGSRVGLVHFNEGTQIDVPPTDDLQRVRDGLDQLSPGGGTATGNAILAAISAIQAGVGDATGADGSLDGTRAVLLSDGKADGRTVNPDRAADEARRLGVSVSAVALGTPEGQITDVVGNVRSVPPDPDALRSIADRSGGTFFASADAVDLGRFYEGLGRSLTTATQTRELTGWAAALAAALLVLAAASAWRTVPRGG